ncbi:MAG: protein translocase subunit SecD [Bdellovibrionaceae bacterium]|nr:protein translocase subunit SecD [Pseudobdellovibrionaceae bacterium]
MFIENKKVRWIIIFCSIALALYIALPNFYPKSDFFSGKKKINYGLDIQGGIYLVMKANVEEAMHARMQKKISILKSDFKDEEIKFKSIEFKKKSLSKIIIQLSDNNKDKVKKTLKKIHNDLQILLEKPSSLELSYYEASLSIYKKQVVEQSIEVVRNRIDAFGVSEPQITAQGSDRILIQLPGVENADQAKELIHRTATLNFRPVYEEVTTDTLQKWVSKVETKNKFSLGTEKSIRLAKNAKIHLLKYRQYIKQINRNLASKLPKNTKLIFQKPPNAKTLEAGRIPFLIKTDNDLSGAYLETARVGSNEYGKPQVNFRFNIQGQKRFAKMTAANIQKRVAIVLDDIVQSAPVIQEEINSPTARITLGSAGDIKETLKEANFLATALRAGALPVQLEQLEERTVGPSLGSDSIKKGKLAGMIGGLLILLFILGYYRGLGVVANIALTLNMLFIIAILTSLQATLTLPGVAGIILTIGMAVDANIIIFERIKEELAKGAGFRSSVRNGFSQAFAAIFDANITTAAVCVVLMYFGSGPVRGFAVTLISGIITSLFTSVFISRSILEMKILNQSKRT